MRKKGRIYICLLLVIMVMGAQNRGVVGEFPYPILPERILSYGYYSDYVDSELNILTTLPDKTWDSKSRAGTWKVENKLYYWQQLDYANPYQTSNLFQKWMGFSNKPRILSQLINNEFIPVYILGSHTGLDLTHNIFLSTEFVGMERECSCTDEITRFYNLHNFTKIGEIKNCSLDNFGFLSSKYAYLDEGLGKKILYNLENNEKTINLYETLGGFKIWKNLVLGDKAVFDVNTGKMTNPFNKDFTGGIPYVCGDIVVYISKTDVDQSAKYYRYKTKVTRLNLPDFKLIDNVVFETDFDISLCFGKNGRYCAGNDWGARAPKGWHILDTTTGRIIYQIPKGAYFSAQENEQIWLRKDNCISIYDLEKKDIVNKVAFGSQIFAQNSKLYLIKNELTKNGTANNVYESNNDFEKSKLLATISSWDSIASIDGDKVAYYTGGDWLKSKIATNVKNVKGEFIEHEFEEYKNLFENGRLYSLNQKNQALEVRNVFIEEPEKIITLKKDLRNCHLLFAKYPWVVIGCAFGDTALNLENTEIKIDLPNLDYIWSENSRLIDNKIFVMSKDNRNSLNTCIIDLENGNCKTLDLIMIDVNESQLVGIKKEFKKGFGCKNKVQTFDTKTLELKESLESPNDYLNLKKYFGYWFTSSRALDSQLNPIQETKGIPISKDNIFSTNSDESGIISYQFPISSIKYSSCPSYTLELSGNVFELDGRRKATFIFTNNSKSNDTPLDIKFQVVPWGDDGFPLLYTKLTDNWINLPGIEKGEKQVATVDVTDALIPNPNLLDATKAGKRLGIVVVANGLMDTLGLEKDPKKTSLARFDGQPISYSKQLAVSVTSFAVK